MKEGRRGFRETHVEQLTLSLSHIGKWQKEFQLQNNPLSPHLFQHALKYDCC